MPLPSPERFLNASMRQGGHREAGMGNAQPGHFLCQNHSRGFYSLAFSSRLCLAPSAFDAFPQNELMNLSHAVAFGSLSFSMQFGLY